MALARIERLDPTYNAFVAVDAERAARRGGRRRRAHRGRARPRAAGRHPARRQGPAERRRLRHDLRLRAARRRPARHGGRPLRRPPARRRLRRGGQDEHAGVRLDGQHDQRHLRRRRATPSTPAGARAAPRAARPPRWRRAWCRSRPGRTAAAPSASRRPCCGLSGMKPSLGRVPGGGANPPGLARALDQRADGAPHRRRGPRARRRRRPRPDRPAGAPPPRGVLAGRARRSPRARPRGVRADARVRHGGLGGGGAPATNAVVGARVAGRRGDRPGLRVRHRPRRRLPHLHRGRPTCAPCGPTWAIPAGRRSTPSCATS